MIKRINFSYEKITKNVKDPNDIDFIEERKIVSKRFLNAVYEDKLILFIDETGFNNNLTPIYGYLLIGKKCQSRCSEESISVLTAITKDELLRFQMFK